MKKCSGLVLGLVFALVGLVQSDISNAQATNQEIGKWQGTWKPKSGSLHGLEIPSSSLQSMSLTISDAYFVALSAQLRTSGMVTLKNEKPGEGYLECTDHDDKNRKLYLKWMITDGKLKIAFSEQAVPVDFNSTPDNKYLVLNYEKAESAANETLKIGNSGAGSGSGGNSGIE